ncbi:TetR/AcrR family transcriptional regulator [Sorangium sp. So ce726]|uniref:TetR/AcrR family transcriptional regulator n=1 Tax=Sorangium sp. So ce726 TaxID=3133319 RepID=UPI003F62486F
MTARRPSLRSRSATPGSRPRRGSPDETRRRLIAAAGVVFNRDGYAGTDSNRIAREAGYSPGTFYKHFADKKEIFIAAYVEWVCGEWAEIGRILGEDLPPREAARTVVAAVVDLHHRWRGLRRSLRALVGEDADIRQAYVAERARQLDTMARLAGGAGGRAEDALLLYLVERTADALADGEPAALGVPADALIDLLVARIEARFDARSA